MSCNIIQLRVLRVSNSPCLEEAHSSRLGYNQEQTKVAGDQEERHDEISFGGVFQVSK
jgi:hypothetical protein